MRTLVGLSGLAGLAALGALAEAPALSVSKPKPRLKPSGKPIPEGTMTRQQRRAAERAQAKRERPRCLQIGERRHD
jgi:hypothetical protein